MQHLLKGTADYLLLGHPGNYFSALGSAALPFIGGLVNIWLF